MSRRALAPPLALWSSAYLGCATFLGIGLLPSTPLSAELLGELAWLSLIGSIPTALLLGSALHASRASGVFLATVAAAIALLGFAVAWEHTDFLLSGPRWAMHPRRGLLQMALAGGLGLLGAGGWSWLVAGARSDGRGRRALWAFATSVVVALLTIAIGRYRAYDYTLAQAVLPGGVLCAGVIHLFCGSSRGRWNAAFGLAAASALFAAGSRISPEWIATGEREVIAMSRAGGLVTLYVLPHLRTEDRWSDSNLECPPTRPVIEQSPLSISASERRNVIVITVDALRKDVVGANESGARITPELSRLAERGISFENATTTYPATLFAVGSAFTGLSPAELYLSPAMPETIFTRARTRVDRQLVILPDVSWFRLPIVQSFLAPGAETSFAPSDAAATRALVDELRAARVSGESVMAWIHYYSPHDPYQSHPSFPFGKGRKNAYFSDVAYFDRQLGKLFAHLEDDGWLDDTLVVFFSDHGEALGEKAYFGHHVYLDGWMVDVPLVLWHASFEPAQPRVGVSIADVAPTVLHFLGIPQPADLPAESLFTLEPNAKGRASFSEAFPVRGEALFNSFRLPALDDATIRARLRSIRSANKGYEPKGAITRDDQRLIHHRGADATLVYERAADGSESPLTGAEVQERTNLLRSELEQWEREQLRRIQCRLRVNALP
jgi:arylsulfatase A-like enzyme